MNPRTRSFSVLSCSISVINLCLQTCLHCVEGTEPHTGREPTKFCRKTSGVLKSSRHCSACDAQPVRLRVVMTSVFFPSAYTVRGINCERNPGEATTSLPRIYRGFCGFVLLVKVRRVGNSAVTTR